MVVAVEQCTVAATQRRNKDSNVYTDCTIFTDSGAVMYILTALYIIAAILT